MGIYARLGIEWETLKSVAERVDTPHPRARVKIPTDAPRLAVTNSAPLPRLLVVTNRFTPRPAPPLRARLLVMTNTTPRNLARPF